MNIEQVVQNFVKAMILESEKVKGLIIEGAMASGGTLPQALPITEAIQNAVPFSTAFPDLKLILNRSWTTAMRPA